MKIAFIGCVVFSEEILSQILAHNLAEVVGIVTYKASDFHGDFRSLEPLAKREGLPVFFAEKNNQEHLVAWLEERSPEMVFCIGWPYLLRQEILSLAPGGVVGYHPTALPKNRGRHPIIWAIALGLTETASTFFIMDEGADSGDIISQIPVSIDLLDNAATLYEKLLNVAKNQVLEFIPQISDGTIVRQPQDHSKANYWRKRSPADGEIDWRMSAETIHNLVRALYHPYPGVHCLAGQHEVKIWKTQLVECSHKYIEPGKIIESISNKIIVKCGVDAVNILEHEFEQLPKIGEYL